MGYEKTGNAVGRPLLFKSVEDLEIRMNNTLITANLTKNL